MVSQLESAIRAQVATAFEGQLMTGTLRRVASTTVDEFGDPVSGTASTWTFDGIVDTFSAQFAQAAGIPITDAKILIIAGSLATTAVKDDTVQIRSVWYQLRQKVEQDPADATVVFAGFEIDDPT